ncbi:MAG: hypothetical protein AAFZ58_11490 [Pseudomonadota bacterium]
MTTMSIKVPQEPTSVAELSDERDIVEYCAGLMSDERRAQFERRLASEPALAEAVAAERQFGRRLEAGNDSDARSASDGFSDLLTRIDRDAAPAQPPMRLAFAASIFAAFIAGAIWWQGEEASSERGEAPFEVLSERQATLQTTRTLFLDDAASDPQSVLLTLMAIDGVTAVAIREPGVFHVTFRGTPGAAVIEQLTADGFRFAPDD